jgi:uncharacterized protein (DUF427 family)
MSEESPGAYQISFARSAGRIRVEFNGTAIADSDTGLAMTLGQTVRVTESGCEPLSRAPLELVEK